jgi:3-oxoacyl-[acyl-carrier protein] reductase
MNANNKVAIVTGASGGIGGQVARRLSKEGFAVVVHYAGSSTHADEVVRDIEGAGRQAVAVAADVADEAEVAELFRQAAALGALACVVHCAGIMPLTRIAEGDLATFDKVMAVNLRGTFVILTAAAQSIGAGGSIIALSSSVVAKNFPGYGPYIASKLGVEGLVRVLANEMRGRNVTVNAVAPGPVATPLFLAGKTEEQIEPLRKMAPLERLGEPEDIAALVSFLASPDGSWVNGQVVRVNGGFA